MTLFAVWARDAEGRLADRERVRPEHRARLRAPAPHAVTVLAAGPLLDPRSDPQSQAMTGTLLVIDAADLAAARAFVDADPYVREGVYASVEILPFRCGLGPWAPS